MDCRAFGEILAEFESRSLKPAEQAQADRHLRECASCRSLVEIARGRRELLSEQGKEEMAGSILLRTSGSTCGRAQELICDFVDNTLDRDSADLVSEHLAHCAPCYSLASNLLELKEILPQLAEVRPDERLTESVMAATIGSKRRLYRPLYPRLQEWWNRLAQRPRLSFEAAYVGTLVMAIFLGNPFPTMRALSVHALETVSQVLPRDLEKNSPEFLRPLKSFALDISNREQGVRQSLDQARLRGETVVATSVTYQLRDLQAWWQRGSQSIRGFSKRLWAGNRKSDPQNAGR